MGGVGDELSLLCPGFLNRAHRPAGEEDADDEEACEAAESDDNTGPVEITHRRDLGGDIRKDDDLAIRGRRCGLRRSVRRVNFSSAGTVCRGVFTSRRRGRFGDRRRLRHRVSVRRFSVRPLTLVASIVAEIIVVEVADLFFTGGRRADELFEDGFRAFLRQIIVAAIHVDDLPIRVDQYTEERKQYVHLLVFVFPLRIAVREGAHRGIHGVFHHAEAVLPDAGVGHVHDESEDDDQHRADDEHHDRHEADAKLLNHIHIYASSSR